MNSGISCHHQRLINYADGLSRIFKILFEMEQSSKAPPTIFSPRQKLDKKLNRLNILKWSIPEFYSVADRGEGPGGPRPPYFQTKLRPEGSKKFFGDLPPPPPYQRVWMTAPPPYLKVEIWHCYLPPKLLQYVAYADTLCSHGRAGVGGHRLEQSTLTFMIVFIGKCSTNL